MKQDKFFVTGATGFLGSHIVRYLLEQGRTVVCLVRGESEEEAEDRLMRVLHKIPSAGAMGAGTLQVVCGNITEPGLGIKDTRHLHDIRYFIHSAADIRFSAEQTDSIFRINLSGSEEALRTARSLSVPFFFHISTAYVSGRREGLIMETLDKGEREFNNDYEKSKAMAEAALVHYAEEHNINISILRPGIIVGDSLYGYIPKLNTIYNFLTPLVRIRNAVDKGRLRDGNVQGAKGGTIHLPVMMPGFEETRLNLVTVDFVVKALSDIIDRERKGIHLYHVVDNNPPSMKDVIDHVADLLNISGIELVTPEYYFKADKKGLDAALFNLNKSYMCYTTSRALYDSSNLDRICPDAFNSIEKKDLFDRMISFTKKKLTEGQAKASAEDYKDIVRYFEVFLENKKGHSLIKNLVSFTSCFEIAFSDIPDRHWSMKIDKGVLISVSANGHNGRPDCRYLVSSSAFRKIITGSISPQECFFKGEIDIQGDMKLGLKLASLMELFFKEHPYGVSEKEPETAGLTV